MNFSCYGQIEEIESHEGGIFTISYKKFRYCLESCCSFCGMGSQLVDLLTIDYRVEIDKVFY